MNRTRCELIAPFVLAFQVGAGAAAPGQSVNLITNVHARSHVSLNGTWRVIVDPYEDGYYDYRYQPRPNGYFSNQKPRSTSDLIEYDFDSADILRVPGDWNSQRAELFFYEGTIWYKTSFPYEKKADKRLFVYFGAANYEAMVFVNGKKVGEHQGGFTPFDYEITDVVEDGDNFLIVKVSNQRQRDAVPTVITDWWNYGGLTRDVTLVEVPSTFIRDYGVHLADRTAGKITGWIQLDGQQARQNVRIRIPEAGVATSVNTDAEGRARFDLTAALTLWSPTSPKLYDVEIASARDTLSDQVGFRTIETQGTDILLNGEPLFLRGICLHEQAPMRDGRAYSAEDARTLLTWAKELNANFVRLAHYPHNEYMVRLADQMGILVWEEIPVYWTINWESPATLSNAQRQLTEMITRDRNRAAVILWSMSNETPLSEARLTFLTELVKTARGLDGTRLITAALERHYVDGTTLMIDDPFGRYLDVIGVNEYVGWYDGLPSKADSLSWRTVYDKPLIMSELGGGALQGYHGDALTRWTEEYQASVYEHQIRMLKRIPFLRGTAPWILADFRSPRRPLPHIQDYWNRKGLISDRGLKKEAFYILREFYGSLKQKP